MKQSRGFTWVETVVILAIITLLALIAIPNLRHQSILRNEANMREDMRVFSAANEAYRMAAKPPAYPAKIADLMDPEKGPSRLDSSWKEAGRNGYRLIYAGGGGESPDTYSLMAVPIMANQTAKNTYCIDQTEILKASIRGENPPAGSAEGCEGGTPAIS